MFKKCLIFLLPIFVSANKPCFDSDPIIKFYQEVGCTPIYENDSKCPTSFDCRQFITRDAGVCRYHNVTYSVGSELTNRDVLRGCGAQNCRCIQNEGRQPEFSCANLECGWPAIGPGCVQVYDGKNCCPNVYCENRDPERSKCTYEGQTYVQGQHIYPEDEPCKKCQCKDGGQVECEEISCDFELHSLPRINENCAPLFYGTKRCCPIDWKCPDEKYKTRKADSGRQANTANRCFFGPQILDQYDILEDENDKEVTCQCNVPPYLTCTKQPATYENSQ